MDTINDTIDIENDTIAITCLYCGDLFQAKSPKAKFCSEACKQKAKRVKQMDAASGEPKTDVDNVFNNHKPGFYRFRDTVRDVKCIICGKRFKTSLELLKTCSIEHRDEVLRNLTGQR